MKKYYAIFALLSAGPLSGCAGNQFLETNQLIADSNATRLAAYGDAMAACGDNAGCLVGVSMAYASKAGDTDFVQPERTAEIIGAWVPIASLGLQAWSVFYNGGVSGTGSSGFVVTGDNNTFSGVGNALEASGGSTLEAPFSSTNTFSWSTGNRDYSIGGTAGEITGDGLTDTYVDDATESTDTGTVEITKD